MSRVLVGDCNKCGKSGLLYTTNDANDIRDEEVVLHALNHDLLCYLCRFRHKKEEM